MNPELFFFPTQKPRSPYSNLAIEESIALNLVKFDLTGGIRLWTNPQSIILGLSEDPNRSIKPEVIEGYLLATKNSLLKKRTIPGLTYIARRASGGGTVFQNSWGNVNYSIYVNLEKRKELFSVRDSYDILLGLVSKSIAKQSIVVSPSGKSDLVITKNGISKKISGNAQFRKKNCIVQHGTLILKNELIKNVTNYLLHPPEEPEYRKNRTHEDFLTSLDDNFSVSQFEIDLFASFLEYLGVKNRSKREDYSFFSKGFYSFRRSVLAESEIIRKRKYENLSYILNREIPP